MSSPEKPRSLERGVVTYTPQPIIFGHMPVGGITIEITALEGGLDGYTLTGISGPPATVKLNGAAIQEYPVPLHAGDILTLIRGAGETLTTLHALAPVIESGPVGPRLANGVEETVPVMPAGELALYELLVEQEVAVTLTLTPASLPYQFVGKLAVIRGTPFEVIAETPITAPTTLTTTLAAGLYQVHVYNDSMEQVDSPPMTLKAVY